MSDVKDVLDVITLLKKTGEAVKEALKDNKINILDLPTFARLWDPAKQAIDGINKVVDELKAMDSAALQTLLVALVDAVAVWMDVLASKKKPAA